MFSFLKGNDKSEDIAFDSSAETVSDDFELEEFDIEVAAVQEKNQIQRSMFKTEVENLMSSLKQQSLDLSCQFATFANWSSEIETMSARAATLQPLLTKLIEENAAQSNAIADFERDKETSAQRIAVLETEVDHFRPLSLRLEEELVSVKEKYSSAQTMLATLEGQFAQRQTENNELMYALAKVESKATRATEENLALRQKANEHNAVIQSQMREIADLKSAISTKSRELQKQEELTSDLTAKLAAAQQSGNHSASTLSAVLLRESQTSKDLQMRLTEARDQMKEMEQKLANRESQVNAAESKIAGLNTKVEFLTQLTQKLRDDMHNTPEVNAKLEASTRQMVNALKEKALAGAAPVKPSAVGADVSKPSVRIIPMQNAARAQSETPVRTQRAS